MSTPIKQGRNQIPQEYKRIIREIVQSRTDGGKVPLSIKEQELPGLIAWIRSVAKVGNDKLHQEGRAEAWKK